MADLRHLSPLGPGFAALQAGRCTLAERPHRAKAGLRPFRGRAAALSEVLGAPLPAPQGRAETAHATVLWAGRGAWLALGAEAGALAPRLHGLAGVTDESDAWAELLLTGPDAEAVLARLCPLDARGLGPAASAPTELAHSRALLTREGAGFGLLLPRSSAAWTVHEIGTAMRSIAAQHGLTPG